MIHGVLSHAGLELPLANLWSHLVIPAIPPIHFTATLMAVVSNPVSVACRSNCHPTESEKPNQAWADTKSSSDTTLVICTARISRVIVVNVRA